METQIEKPAPTKTTGLENCNETNSNTYPKIRTPDQLPIAMELLGGMS